MEDNAYLNYHYTAECRGGAAGGVTLYRCTLRSRGSSGADPRATTRDTRDSLAAQTAPAPPPIQL